MGLDWKKGRFADKRFFWERVHLQWELGGIRIEKGLRFTYALKEIAHSGGTFTFTYFEGRGVAPGFNVLSSWPLVAQELCVSFRVLAVTFKLLKKQEK